MEFELEKEGNNKLLKGLGKAYDNMVEEKKRTNSEIVVLRDNKIVNFIP